MAKSRKSTKPVKVKAKPKKSALRKAKAPADPRDTASKLPFATVTPYLAVENATQAIDWYRKAFNAKELTRMPAPGGKLMHAEIRIGDARVMLSDMFPGSDIAAPTDIKGTTVNLHVWTRNIDKIWKQATDAGAKVTMPLADQFWGDRYGKIVDPFGHSWSVAWKSKLSKPELKKLEEEAMKQFAAFAPTQ